MAPQNAWRSTRSEPSACEAVMESAKTQNPKLDLAAICREYRAPSVGSRGIRSPYTGLSRNSESGRNS